MPPKTTKRTAETGVEKITPVAESSSSTTSSGFENIAVSGGVKQKAKNYAKELEVTLKDFAESAMLYFIKYKMNPTVEIQVEDIPKEVHRLRNHIFGFLKTQEQQFIIPILKEIYTLKGDSKDILSDIAALSDTLSKLHDQLYAIYTLLYKIKTIQDISLTTQYNLSDLSKEELKELIKQNKQKFKAEITQFEANTEGEFPENEDL